MPSGLMAPAYLRATRPSGTARALHRAARSGPSGHPRGTGLRRSIGARRRAPDRSRALRGVRARLPAGRRAHAHVSRSSTLASDSDQRDHVVQRRRRARPGGCRARPPTRSSPCGPGCSSASTASARSAPGFRRGWWSVPISPTRCSRSCSRSAPSSPCPGSMTSATTGRGCWRSTRGTWPPCWWAPTRSGTARRCGRSFPPRSARRPSPPSGKASCRCGDINPDIHAWPRGSALEDQSSAARTPRPSFWCAATSSAATRPSPFFPPQSARRRPAGARGRHDRPPSTSPGPRSARRSTRRPWSSASASTRGTVLGEGWYVCLEEPFTEPRVGLDEPDVEAPVYGRAPDARRGRTSPGAHVAKGPAKYAAMTPCRPRRGNRGWTASSSTTSPGAATAPTWPASPSSEPFRFVIAAGDLIGGGRERPQLFDELDEALPLVAAAREAASRASAGPTRHPARLRRICTCESIPTSSTPTATTRR